jgi:hypothetical protein
MKKTLALITPAVTYLTLTPIAFATNTLCPQGTSDFNGLCTVSISGVIGPLINLIFIIAIIAALLYLVYGGFKWLTSGGDKQAVASAREHIVAAIIGLVIIFLSYFILQIIIGFFVPNFNWTTFELPDIGA